MHPQAGGQSESSETGRGPHSPPSGPPPAAAPRAPWPPGPPASGSCGPGPGSHSEERQASGPGRGSKPQPGSTSTWAGGAGSQQKGSRDNCPGSGLDCGNKETGAQRVGPAPGDRARPAERGWGSALLTPSPGQGCERTLSQPPPATPHWPGAGPTSGPAGGSGPGRAGSREPTLACSCCFCWPICCSISSYSCWTSRWWSESRLEGEGGGPGSASAPPGPAAAGGPGLESIYCSPGLGRDPDPRYPGNSYPNSSPSPTHP